MSDREIHCTWSHAGLKLFTPFPSFFTFSSLVQDLFSIIPICRTSIICLFIEPSSQDPPRLIPLPSPSQVQYLCPSPLRHHHHHHDAWTFVATLIPETTPQHFEKSLLQHRVKAARERGRVQEYGGQGHNWGRAVAGSPHSRQKYPRLCKYSLSQQGDKSLQR